MATLLRTAFVPYSAQQMFDLVNDIEKYPAFLPWCSGVTIFEQAEKELKARVTVGKSGFTQTFATQNNLIPHERIEMRLLEGPFRFLEGVWKFQDAPEKGSQITLNLAFEFNNPLLSFSVGSLIHPVAGTLVQVFTQRAHVLYGK
jgi:ribosome-associated toxin RatA of RatAB toxin-antitoxin module